MPSLFPDWSGQDAYIIGGGSSLRGFDFNSLSGLNTIGVNDAFRLGEHGCKICVFGDASWFHKVKWDLEKFKGITIHSSDSLKNFKLPWLHYLRRVETGFYPRVEPPGVAWNLSSGASAVNIAYLCQAKRVFLLGFDMASGKNKKTHWHDLRTKTTTDASFAKFIRGFKNVADYFAKHPETKVFNVTDGTSKLPYFQRISFADMERMKNGAD